eukprot:67019-Amphidinium_carterae.1
MSALLMESDVQHSLATTTLKCSAKQLGRTQPRNWTPRQCYTYLLQRMQVIGPAVENSTASELPPVGLAKSTQLLEREREHRRY